MVDGQSGMIVTSDSKRDQQSDIACDHGGAVPLVVRDGSLACRPNKKKATSRIGRFFCEDILDKWMFLKLKINARIISSTEEDDICCSIKSCRSHLRLEKNVLERPEYFLHCP